MPFDKSVRSVIIVGGGSTGCSIAYNLAIRGVKVTLLDRGNIASGNTGKSSALVRTHYSNRLIASMALYSINQFNNFNMVGYSGFTRTGMVFPFNGNNAETARKNRDMLLELGIHENEISVSQVREFFPDIDSSDFDYILYEPESGYADPVATASAYANAARTLGAEIYTGTEVTKVESGRKSASVYLASGKKYSADAVILATNTWTNNLLRSSGLDDSMLPPLYASVHDIIYVRRPENCQGIKPTLWDPQKSAYYKMEGETLTAIGSLDPHIDKQVFDVTKNIEDHVTDSYIEEYLAKITERIPSMGDASIVAAISGLYDMSPDGQAIIDSMASNGMENVYICAGLSGHGFKLSPAYGVIVADMVTGIAPESSLFDWSQFSLARFKNGTGIKSMYSGIGTIY